jgi:hypothetical protein
LKNAAAGLVRPAKLTIGKRSILITTRSPLGPRIKGPDREHLCCGTEPVRGARLHQTENLVPTDQKKINANGDSRVTRSGRISKVKSSKNISPNRISYVQSSKTHNHTIAQLIPNHFQIVFLTRETAPWTPEKLTFERSAIV